jgi:hypothetical protein
MLAAPIIVFREVFEAGLIVGIVLAVTKEIQDRNKWIAAVCSPGYWALVWWQHLPQGFRNSLPEWVKRSSTQRYLRLLW